MADVRDPAFDGWPEPLDRIEGQPKRCVHPYVWQTTGRCEGCRTTPLPLAEREDDQRAA